MTPERVEELAKRLELSPNDTRDLEAVTALREQAKRIEELELLVESRVTAVETEEPQRLKRRIEELEAGLSIYRALHLSQETTPEGPPPKPNHKLREIYRKGREARGETTP